MSLGDRRLSILPAIVDSDQAGDIVHPERTGTIMVNGYIHGWVRICTPCVGLVSVFCFIWILVNGMPNVPHYTFLLGLYALLLSTIVIRWLTIACGSDRRSPKSETSEARMCTAQDLDLLSGVLLDDPSNVGPEWRCTICLCDSHGDGQQLRELGLCKHVFHRDCIDQWFLGTPLFSLKCPLCRGPVFKPETPEIEVPSPVSAGRPHFVDRNDIGLPGA